MKKNPLLLLALLITGTTIAQKVNGKLKFEKGQSFDINLEVKTTISQQAMGQAIDFNADGTAIRKYDVTNATDDNTTLHHQVQHIAFTFDGMGQKRSFDSDKPKDMDGLFGKTVKDVLGKSYDMVIDPNGTVMMAIPGKFETSETDSRLLIVINMLKDVLGTVQPPKKGEASFFKVLPDKEINAGDTWTETINTDTERGSTNYKLSSITDSTIVIDFTGSSSTISKTQMMGMETTTNLNNKSTGKIIIDKATGIIREKNSETESTGTTEAMRGTVPISSKTTIVIKVLPKQQN